MLSPDGRRLASGSQDYTVKVWDAATGQEILTLKKGFVVPVSVAFSPDGQRLAAAGAAWREYAARFKATARPVPIV